VGTLSPLPEPAATPESALCLIVFGTCRPGADATPAVFTALFRSLDAPSGPSRAPLRPESTLLLGVAETCRLETDGTGWSPVLGSNATCRSEPALLGAGSSRPGITDTVGFLEAGNEVWTLPETGMDSFPATPTARCVGAAPDCSPGEDGILGWADAGPMCFPNSEPGCLPGCKESDCILGICGICLPGTASGWILPDAIPTFLPWGPEDGADRWDLLSNCFRNAEPCCFFMAEDICCLPVVSVDCCPEPGSGDLICLRATATEETDC